MSHFTVMVIGNNPEEQLLPFHEFECTGLNNEYIQEIDETKTKIKEYEKYKEENQTFEEYLLDEGYNFAKDYPELDIEENHKYSYFYKTADGEIKVVRRTNPNAKWDWYLLGGRWSGYFKLKKYKNGIVGEPGLMTPPAKVGYADQAYKKDIDWGGMMQEATEKAEIKYNKAHSIINGREFYLWDHVRDNMNLSIDEAGEFYNNQEVVKDFKKSDEFYFREKADDFIISKEKYLDNAGKEVICPFALILDGKWYERGEMGWWGCVFNGKEQDKWNDEFFKLFNEISEDTLISMFDCHI